MLANVNLIPMNDSKEVHVIVSFKLISSTAEDSIPVGIRRVCVVT